MTQPLKNILLICMDDAVAYWHYRHTFGTELQTPNLDRICAQSTAFQAAYCQTPVCSPSRASFMSGLSPHQTGVVKRNANYLDDFAPQNLWPYALKQAGFYSSTGGKVVRGYRALPEWAHEILHSDPRTGYHTAKRRRAYEDRVLPGHVEFGGFRGGLAAESKVAKDRLYCNRVARRAVAFLEDYDDEAPFYRGVGFQSPHGPWITPKSFKRMYPVWKFEQPEAWAQGFPNPPEADRISPPNFDAGKMRFWKKSLRNYFSSFSYGDQQLGRVWDALKASKHADDTLVVILSDHGHHLGERSRFNKGTLYEQTCNVPLIIHDPRAPEGQVVTDPVALVDVANTVMDFLGQPPVADSPGRSLRPQMEGARAPDRAVPTFHHDCSAIRKGDYRFIRYGDGTTEFYDVVRDWWQTAPLGDDHPEFAAMREAHDQCCAAYGMPMATGEAGETPGPA